MRYCIICGQTSSSTVHLFPVPQDEDKRNKWISSLEVYLPQTALVCSKHFPSQFLGKKKIKKGALPTKKLLTPSRSDDFDVIEPYNGTPSASKGGYQYSRLKKSSNNIVTWLCVKNETEKCEGRLTSKFGIVLKQFKHTCKRDVTAASWKKLCDNAEKDIPSEDQNINVEEITNGKEGVTKSSKSTSLDLKGPSSQEIGMGKKMSSQLEPENQPVCESTSEHQHEDSLEYDLNIERTIEEFTILDTDKPCSAKDQVICRLCLEPNNKKTVTHLTLSEVDSLNEKDSFKKIRAMENAMFNNMIETLLPNFDLSLACNPVMCTKCRALLISAYNFVEKCTHNENMIYLYKSELAADKDKVYCEDVVKNLPILMREDPPRKKLKTEPHEIEEAVSSEQTPSYNIVDDCLSEPSPVVKEETTVKDFSSDFADTSIRDHDYHLETMPVLENKKPSSDERISNKPGTSGKVSVETQFFNKSFKVTNPSSFSYVVVVPKEKSNVDVDFT